MHLFLPGLDLNARVSEFLFVDKDRINMCVCIDEITFWDDKIQDLGNFFFRPILAIRDGLDANSERPVFVKIQGLNDLKINAFDVQTDQIGCRAKVFLYDLIDRFKRNSDDLLYLIRTIFLSVFGFFFRKCIKCRDRKDIKIRLFPVFKGNSNI